MYTFFVSTITILIAIMYKTTNGAEFTHACTDQAAVLVQQELAKVEWTCSANQVQTYQPAYSNDTPKGLRPPYCV